MKLLASLLVIAWILFCIFAPTILFNIVCAGIAGYSIGYFACSIWIESNDYTRN